MFGSLAQACRLPAGAACRNLAGTCRDLGGLKVSSKPTASGSDTYLHRVGRAGRFGTKGLALTFISTDEDQEVLKKVQARFLVAANH